jgi:hypothetical protein
MCVCVCVCVCVNVLVSVCVLGHFSAGRPLDAEDTSRVTEDTRPPSSSFSL